MPRTGPARFWQILCRERDTLEDSFRHMMSSSDLSLKAHGTLWQVHCNIHREWRIQLKESPPNQYSQSRMNSQSEAAYIPRASKSTPVPEYILWSSV